MDKLIQVIQSSLDDISQSCLRMLSHPQVTSQQSRQLNELVSDVLKLKHELPEDVRQRGSQAMSEVLQVTARVCQVVVEIENASQETETAE